MSSSTMAICCGAAVCVVLVTMVLLLRRKKSTGSGGSVIHLTCGVCQNALTIQRNALSPLSSVECALATREKRALSGKKLAEFTCPSCGAAHCFDVDGKHIQWVGANLYESQETSSQCTECGKPLRTPPWPPPGYGKALEEVPDLPLDYGLVCSRCQSVCCVKCCSNMARVRGGEVKWVCPRCSRHPINTLFFP